MVREVRGRGSWIRGGSVRQRSTEVGVDGIGSGRHGRRCRSEAGGSLWKVHSCSVQGGPEWWEIHGKLPRSPGRGHSDPDKGQ